MGTVKKELPLARSMCWHCQSDIGGEYFCNQCVKVQPLSKDMDYFTCFGLPRKLNIDAAQLQTKFYELSRGFQGHPWQGAGRPLRGDPRDAGAPRRVPCGQGSERCRDPGAREGTPAKRLEDPGG